MFLGLKPGGRGLHGKEVTNVVGLCSAESLRGYGGVYPDIDKVAMQEHRHLKNAVSTELTGERGHNSKL
jgi:hypothetical protein